jgi:hypothetical protein
MMDGASQILDMLVLMDRAVDRAKPCHQNIVKISGGRGPHTAELRCVVCNAHRGWLSKFTCEFLSETVRRFGVSSEPFVVHDANYKGSNMTDISEIYPDKSPYLKAPDLQNRTVTLVIEEVVAQEVGKDGNREVKPVCKFKGKAKKFVLNKTNARLLAELYGPRIEDWADKEITLVPSVTDWPKPGTACIKMQAPRDYVPSEEVAPAKPPHDPTLDDEIPF